MPRFRVYRVSSFGVMDHHPTWVMKGYSGDLTAPGVKPSIGAKFAVNSLLLRFVYTVKPYLLF